MKKFFASIAAVMLIAISAVPAFAYDSPEATTLRVRALLKLLPQAAARLL
ncbi:MAG: hypothetical protein U0K87_07820 [Ruminococcus sp.]|nr:hypothetical protein [Ruminococcus sp.]